MEGEKEPNVDIAAPPPPPVVEREDFVIEVPELDGIDIVPGHAVRFEVRARRVRAQPPRPVVGARPREGAPRAHAPLSVPPLPRRPSTLSGLSCTSALSSSRASTSST